MLIDFKDNEEFQLLEALTNPLWTQVKNDKILINFVKYLTVSEQTNPSFLDDCILFDGKYYVLYCPSLQHVGGVYVAGIEHYIHVQGTWFEILTYNNIIDKCSIIINNVEGLRVNVDFFNDI